MQYRSLQYICFIFILNANRLRCTWRAYFNAQVRPAAFSVGVIWLLGPDQVPLGGNLIVFLCHRSKWFSECNSAYRSIELDRDRIARCAVCSFCFSSFQHYVTAATTTTQISKFKYLTRILWLRFRRSNLMLYFWLNFCFKNKFTRAARAARQCSK